MHIAQHVVRAAAAAALVALGTSAFLLTPVGGTSTANASVPGLEVVSAVTGGGSSSPKSAVATCPSGKRVVGTGVYIDGESRGKILLDDLVPTSNSVQATGYEGQGGTAESWWIRAFAVCADPLPGLAVVTATSASNSNTKSVKATCARGKRALGGGAMIVGSAGQIVLNTMLPTDGGVRATAYEDFDGTPGNWTLTGYAICANPPAGLTSATTTVPDSTTAAARPACAAGTQPLGLGWEIVTPRPGRVVVDVAMPDAGGALVGAVESRPTGGAPPSLTARVLCATP